MDKAKDFRELFDRHYRELCLYATHFTSDIDAAEDIVPMIDRCSMSRSLWTNKWRVSVSSC